MHGQQIGPRRVREGRRCVKMDIRYRRYQEQRLGSLQRGIPWLLPYWEWLQVWEESGHFHERGRKKGEWVMARYGDEGPYSRENVSIIRAEKNVSDAHRKRRQPV